MEETLKKVQEMLDAFKKDLPKGMTAEEMKSAVTAEWERLKGEFAPQVSKEEFAKLEKAMKEQGSVLADLQKSGLPSGKKMTIAEGIVKAFEENGIKSTFDAKKFVGEEIEIKAENPLTNTSYDGDYGRTQPVSGLRFPNERPKTFLDSVKRGFVSAGKNIIMWTVGAFTEVVGYSGELDDITTGESEISGSSASATDKTRRLSKIAARMILSAEVFEDLAQFAQRVEMKLMEKIDLWLDQKIWNGDGNDSTQALHIYGVKTDQCTAFDAVNAPKVEKAHIGDLVDACKLQSKNNYFNSNVAVMSPAMSFKYQHTKDTTGNYIINRLADGTLVMNGLTVKESPLFDADMLVGDLQLIQLWIKRNLSMEIVRNAKRDCYELYIYARQQVLVEDEDKKGLIYVEDIDDAITAITPTTTP